MKDLHISIDLSIKEMEVISSILFVNCAVSDVNPHIIYIWSYTQGKEKQKNTKSPLYFKRSHPNNELRNVIHLFYLISPNFESQVLV